MLHPELLLPDTVMIIDKATDARKEAYSFFERTELERDLNKKGVKRIFCGRTLNRLLYKGYCVRRSQIGVFETVLLLDTTVGVNLKSDGSETAIKEMTRKGAKTKVIGCVRT